MKFLLLLIVVVAYVAKGEALKCYVCSSAVAKGCADPFDSKGTGVVEHECTPNALCWKSIISVNSANHTVRDCLPISNNDGNLNRATNVSGNAWLCETDLCNGASSLTATTALLASMALAGILVLKN